MDASEAAVAIVSKNRLRMERKTLVQLHNTQFEYA